MISSVVHFKLFWTIHLDGNSATFVVETKQKIDCWTNKKKQKQRVLFDLSMDVTFASVWNKYKKKHSRQKLIHWRCSVLQCTFNFLFWLLVVVVAFAGWSSSLMFMYAFSWRRLLVFSVEMVLSLWYHKCADFVGNKKKSAKVQTK